MRLEPGDKAPAFSLVDDHGNTQKLSDYKGRKLLIYFYPRAFTPGCTTEACDFRDRHQAMAKAGYDLLGVSPDRVETLARFRDEHALPFPLVADPSHRMAEKYGAWGTRKNYGREYEGIIRSTFAIDERGHIEHAWYNVRARGHADRIGEELNV